MAPSIRQAVSSIDRSLGISDMKTMDSVLADSLSQPRLSAFLLGFFAFLSLGLAVVGVYGVLSYAVTQRTREIGVRMALGAQPSQLVKLFVSEGAILVAAGTIVGIFVALAVGRLLRSLLFETAPGDLISAAMSVGAIACFGIAAVWVPARRASKVDPMSALRAD